MVTQNNTNSNDQKILEAKDQLEILLAKVKKVNQDIEQINSEAKKEIKEIKKIVDESIVKIEKIFTELDQAEKEAGDQLDKLISQQTEDLVKE